MTPAVTGEVAPGTPHRPPAGIIAHPPLLEYLVLN